MTRDSNDEFVTDRDEDTFGGEIVTVGAPATTLVAGYLLLTIVVGVLVGTSLYTNPDLFGEDGYARLAGLLVYLLAFIGAIRLAIKYVVLMRTKYVVTPDSVRRTYKLAYREQSRELPLHMIRGVEITKSRMQAILGYATISFLAVGSNRGIGYIEFDNAANPESLQGAVLDLLERQRREATTDGEPGTPSAASTGTSSTDDHQTAGGTREVTATDTTDAGEPQQDSIFDSDEGTQGTAPDASASSDGDSDPGDDADSLAGGDTDPLAGDDATDTADSGDDADDARRPVSGNDHTTEVD